MKGYIDSIAFEFDSCILAKFHLFGVERVAKNGIIFDESLLEMFLSNRMTKSKKKQLIELKNLYSYLAILETQTGLKYKVMQHKRAKKVNITFQGLKQYTEVSELMEHDLKDFIELYRDYISIMRLDVAIDNKEPFNKDKIARNTNRIISERWNTTYFKTEKEKRKNEHLNIKHYYKKVVQLFRLEFVFGRRYFKAKDPLRLIENTIKKAIKKQFKFQDDFTLIS
jgi:hypothetical protein